MDGNSIIVTLITALGLMVSAFLKYRAEVIKAKHRLEEENKALKNTVANIHNQVQPITINNHIFYQAPEEIRRVLLSVSATTDGTNKTTPIPMPNFDGNDSRRGKEKK